MRRTTYVHLEDCTLSALTERAALVCYDDEEYWFPLTQLGPGEAEKLHKVRLNADEFTLTVTEWIAKQKEIDI
jgi:hypothetical protein